MGLGVCSETPGDPDENPTSGARCREMLVQWTTVERGRPAARWGPRSGEYTDVAPASLDTYTRGDMCGGASANLDVVCRLAPGSSAHALLHGGTRPGAELHASHAHHHVRQCVSQFTCGLVAHNNHKHAGGAWDPSQSRKYLAIFRP